MAHAPPPRVEMIAEMAEMPSRAETLAEMPPRAEARAEVAEMPPPLLAPGRLPAICGGWQPGPLTHWH